MFSFFKKNKPGQHSTGFFEYKNSKMIEIVEANDMSNNDVCNFLGYHPDTIFTHYHDLSPNANYISFNFKIFTKELVFISTNKSITNPNLSLIKNSINKLSFDELYEPSNIEFILEAGIENQSISCDLLCANLKMDSKLTNGLLFFDKLGLYLEFSNGLIESFQSASGLNTSAKDIQKINPKLIESYWQESEKYWGNDKLAIYNEINTQMNSLTNMPSPLKNPYVEKHKNEFGNINYFNLLICHYGNKINRNEFVKINHGRYESLSNNQLKVGNFVFEFDSNDNILNTYTF
jgi:hypothetical protein